MSIYLIIVALTLILGVIMPQQGPKRKNYIILMAVIHGFICAFRYQYLTGDLMKYQWNYSHLFQYGWFSEEVLQEGRNAGFQLLMKLTALIFNNQFQPFLVILAIFGEVTLAIVIYRYSPAPWMSYLIWNCMGFYVFGFSAIKQAVAMATLMLAFIAIVERKLGLYLILMAISGLLHTPSLIFLPAYWLAQMRVTWKTVLFYLILILLMNVFKEQFVNFIMSFYYEEDTLEIFSGEIGSRFIMVLGFCLFGVLFRGFKSRTFTALFHIMAIAAVLQMLAGFNNVFTRLTDYYFQFSVLYLPMVFFGCPDKTPGPTSLPAVFPFNKRSMKVLAGLVVVFVIWFYYTYNINISLPEVDNYLNYRTMWH